MDWDVSSKCAGVGGCGTPGSCPTIVSCPPGLLRCASDGSCRAAATECPSSGSAPCPATQARCNDGSCADNYLLCPTPATCPLWAPVRCIDNSCADRQAGCTHSTTPSCSGPQQEANQASQCPDGSCVATRALCGSQLTCPRFRPVKCITGECVVGIADCPTEATSTKGVCPYARPWKCPDGTCAERQGLCAPLPQCSSLCFLVKYPDGSCQTNPPGTMGAATFFGAVPHQCRWEGQSLQVDRTLATPPRLETPPYGISRQGCPEGFIRCHNPSGMCAASAALCPTLPTCPAQRMSGDGARTSFHKCWDFSCRAADEACQDMTELKCDPGTLLCLDGVSCRYVFALSFWLVCLKTNTQLLVLPLISLCLGLI